MKNRIELLGCGVAELFSPIQSRQVSRDEIPAVPREIFEITRAKIIDDRETRIREFLLQGEREIRADEPGAASDNKIRRRVQFRKYGN